MNEFFRDEIKIHLLIQYYNHFSACSRLILKQRCKHQNRKYLKKYTQESFSPESLVIRRFFRKFRFFKNKQNKCAQLCFVISAHHRWCQCIKSSSTKYIFKCSIFSYINCFVSRFMNKVRSTSSVASYETNQLFCHGNFRCVQFHERSIFYEIFI